MSDKLADWTKGAEAIVYQSCGPCGNVQYFHRRFCAACGAPDPTEKRASGAATVYATSLVCRAATPDAALALATAISAPSSLNAGAAVMC